MLVAAVALLGWAGVGLATAPAARADATGQHITRYTADVAVTADGVARVTLDFDFDFGNDPGHGPYLTLPVRQRIDGNDKQDRVFRISAITASSATAPAQVNREDSADAIVLKIGDPNQGQIQGVHTYDVSYTVDGWINPDSTTHDGDQLYWNVIGPDWQIPLANLSVTVTGPAEVARVTCFAGPYGSTDPCGSAVASGPTATFTQADVPVGDEFSVVTGWPAGTFPGVGLILSDRPNPLDPVTPTPVTGGLALLVAGAGSAFAISRVRRTGRDRAYLGLTPGLMPAAGQAGTTGYRDKRGPVAVQFSPPKDARAGELGTLLDETADPRDVTATIIDLAVRGFLQIREVPRKDPRRKVKDWELVALNSDRSGLLAFESKLLDELFGARASVKLSDLKTTFAASMALVQTGLYEDVTSKGWFSHNPRTVRREWGAAGAVLLVLGVGGAVVSGGTGVKGLSLVGGAVAVVGLLVLALARSAPARTAAGTAVLAEAVGFQRYLETAEANQIRFEEGEDLFSRYLPYAIVFGVAERWAGVFGELAAQGRAVPEPVWYSGSSFQTGAFWMSYAAFGHSLESFTSIATQSLSAPTPGSSGGSGFSGGGFSGGGVGGGGGGGW
ncbi:MAG TPA: DUF2207 domain-containing protein [Cellulomonas sp.]|uniref:DUF2207 domain-containing protein n=1 Tax=Cellulomonas sp. TaxID=40001 RepID=UPI002E335AB1|nr:DUF2207 domain-containing protein [Cellulomonas sp.]HEX5331547.1 DUF2207 domain-containing protein [Cellulomonas sp.]